MKGIIFNLLEQVVSDAHGDAAWDGLLESTGLEGSYTAVGSYPDEELVTLVAAASAALGTPPDALVQWFGRSALPLLAKRYPAFFQAHDDTRSFMLTLNDVIHPEVRKLFPGAYAPSFDFDTSDEHALALSYFSHRNLCSFAEGLIEGAADHYGEVVLIEQSACSKRGDDRCVFHISFKKG